jgi:uncharacterized membrane protein YbjE (DUF340 family)
MSATFNVPITLPDTIVEKIAVFTFTKKKDWMAYANNNKILPEELAQLLNAMLLSHIRGLSSNSSWTVAEQLPKETVKFIVSQAGYDIGKLNGKGTIRQILQKVEEDTNCMLIFQQYSGEHKAYLIPRSGS